MYNEKEIGNAQTKKKGKLIYVLNLLKIST